MRVINISLNELETKVLMIGFEGENQITQVRIDAAKILTDYPTATPTLIVKPLFGFAYPVIVTMEGTDVVWEIDNSVLSSHGDGEIQLTFTQGTVIAKSYVGRIRIKRSLTVTGEAPDPIETWEQAATAKLAEVDAQIGELEDMVEAAEAAKDEAQDIVDDAAADIQAAGAAQVQVVQAKGTEVLNSIPADYSTLSGDVSGLKSAFDGDNRLLNNCIDIQNILPRALKTSLVQGVTAIYDDGVITLSGTAQYSGGRTVKITPVFDLDAGTYVATRSNGNIATYIEKEENDSIILTLANGDNIFTLSERTSVYIGISVDNGTAYSNVVNNVQIVKGSVSYPFQKTTTGVPNDTIARERIAVDRKYIDGNKLMIESMSDTINLLPVVSTITDINNVAVSYNYGEISAIGTANASGGRTLPIAPLITLKQGTYLFKRDFSNIALFLTNVNDGSDYIFLGGNNTIVSFTVQTEKTYIIGVNVDNGVSYNVSGHIQISAGTESIDFVATYNRKAFDLQARDDINIINRIIADSNYPSKNILPVYDGERTVNGVKVKYTDGAIETQGIATATGGITAYIVPNITLQPGQYVLSRNFVFATVYLTNVNDTSDYVSLLYESGQYVNERTFVINEEKTFSLGLNFESGRDYSGLFGMIQLVSGSEAGDIVRSTYVTPKGVDQLKTELDEATKNINKKINRPSSEGTLGQVLATNGDGTTSWTSAATPTDQQIKNAINAYLDDNPEILSAFEYVTPELYGAYGNGVNDDSIAFHSALYSGKAVYLTGTYLLKTNRTVHNGLTFIDDLPDGVVLFGHGTILFPPNANQETDSSLGLNLFYINGKCTIRDITIDMNGNNNIVGGYTRTMYALYGSMSNSLLDNLTVKNCAGRNMLCIQSGDCNRIVNSKFMLGGTNILNNVNQDDFSFIYCLATNTVFDNCNIDGVNPPITNGSGGIEVHGSHSRVTNCTIKNVSDGIYIANNDANNPLTDIVLSHNSISARRGIGFWYLYSFENITMTDNIIVFSRIPDVNNESVGIIVLTDGSNIPDVKGLVVANNQIIAGDVLSGYAVDLRQAENIIFTANNIKTTMNGVQIIGDNVLSVGNLLKCNTTHAMDVTANSKTVNNNLII